MARPQCDTPLVYDWQGLVTHLKKIKNWIVGCVFLMCRAKKIEISICLHLKRMGTKNGDEEHHDQEI